jgi:hypothetical protein
MSQMTCKNMIIFLLMLGTTQQINRGPSSCLSTASQSLSIILAIIIIMMLINSSSNNLVGS